MTRATARVASISILGRQVPMDEVVRLYLKGLAAEAREQPPLPAPAIRPATGPLARVEDVHAARAEAERIAATNKPNQPNGAVHANQPRPNR